MSLKLKLQLWYAKKQRDSVLHTLKDNTTKISESLKIKVKTLYIEDELIVGQALYRGIISLNELKDEFRQNINLVRYALKNNGLSLQYADKKFKDDLELIKLAVTYNSNVLIHASENIRNNNDLFLTRVKTKPEMALYLGKKLQNDRSYIYKLLRLNLKVYKYLPPKIKNNKSIAIEVLKKDFKLIADMDENLQKDLDILLSASYYARDEDPKPYISPFYFKYIADSTEACYMYENRYLIEEPTFPIVKDALLKNPDAIINPPESIAILVEDMEDPYLVLANYALGQKMIISSSDDVKLPDDLLL